MTSNDANRYGSRAYLDLPSRRALGWLRWRVALSTAIETEVLITLNGEQYEIERRLSVIELLTRLDIDPRRVAIEHNLTIIKRHTFSDVIVGEGDTVEIVNFVGGG
jgi:sulfur carrier protein